MSTSETAKPIDLTLLTDSQLSAALREQVTLARNAGQYNRDLTRAIAAEAVRRGWKTPLVKDPL